MLSQSQALFLFFLIPQESLKVHSRFPWITYASGRFRVHVQSGPGQFSITLEELQNTQDPDDVRRTGCFTISSFTASSMCQDFLFTKSSTYLVTFGYTFFQSSIQWLLGSKVKSRGGQQKETNWSRRDILGQSIWTPAAACKRVQGWRGEPLIKKTRFWSGSPRQKFWQSEAHKQNTIKINTDKKGGNPQRQHIHVHSCGKRNRAISIIHSFLCRVTPPFTFFFFSFLIIDFVVVLACLINPFLRRLLRELFLTTSLISTPCITAWIVC